MLRRILPVLMLALPALATAGAAQSDPRTRWLADHASPLRTLDFADQDDADLAPIARAIGNRRMVFLGEQSHGDGATFQAKARIIRFLHRRLGFDLLVFESGFYDCRRTWVDAGQGAILADSASGCMFGLWANSEQVIPLLGYLDDMQRGVRPLELAGMDFQPSGSKARELFTDAARFFAAQPDGRSAMADLAIAQGIFERLFTAPREFMTASDSSRNTFRSALTRVLARPINPVPDLGPLGDPGFWRQTLAGLMAWADFTWALNPGQPDPAVFNRRDSVMAANLIWLASTRPNRKVIVWGATSHFIRNRTGITDDPAPNMVPTGHLASMALPGETYIIGFLAAEGETGSANPGTRTPRAPVEAADPMTLDGLWATTGQELGFLDLRELPRGGDWLRRPVTARPLGYLPMTAIWPDHLDGFVFTRRMTPSTPRR